jgi:hypothetical protein
MVDQQSIGAGSNRGAAGRQAGGRGGGQALDLGVALDLQPIEAAVVEAAGIQQFVEMGDETVPRDRQGRQAGRWAEPSMGGGLAPSSPEPVHAEPEAAGPLPVLLIT